MQLPVNVRCVAVEQVLVVIKVVLNDFEKKIHCHQGISVPTLELTTAISEPIIELDWCHDVERDVVFHLSTP